ncbi:MAG: TonB-dependent receptor [Brevundimonas sp.]|uniref:TonB-dependent receptor n=1 Tax=Brevundimonas sp. TaxID=1871086 RepID=UPI003918ABEF
MATAALALVIALPVIAMPAAASAQDGPTTVDELLITLQKREQSIVDVPAVVTAYSGEFLDELGIQDFAELSAFVPGFLVQDQSPNNPGFVMRGITSDSGQAFVEPRVSVFQDGVSISKSRGSYVELFDLERIEVARGPQSTLFGRGALIGAANIIQAKPNLFVAEGRASVGAGDYGSFLLESMANLPITENIALRAAFRVRERDGYIESLLPGERDFNSINTAAARISLRIAPSDRANLDLIFNYQTDRPTGTSFKSMNYLPTNPATGAVLGDTMPWTAAALSAGAGFVDGGRLGLDRTVQGVSALFDYNISNALTLSSITAVRRFRSLEIVDGDGLSLPILTFSEDAFGDQFSQELRINFDNGGRVRWFAGVGYFEEDGYQRTPAQFDERMALAQITGQLHGGAAGTGLPANHPAPAALFANTAFTGALLQGLVFASSNGNVLLTAPQAQAIAANLRANHAETATNASDLRAIDIFADVSFDLTDRLELGLGLRYTRDERTTAFSSSLIGAQRSVLGGVIGASGLAADGSAAGIAQANAILGALAVPNAAFIPQSMMYPIPQFGLTFQPTAGGAAFSQDSSDEGFTWRLTARYALSPDASVFATYARGRRPEVLSVGSPSAPGGLPRFGIVEAETVDSIEVGYKAVRLMGGVLRFDASAFYYDYSNFQTTVQQGTLFVTTNAGEATAYGFETQAFLAAAPGLDLFATYGFNRARFGSGLFEGNRFRLSPDHSASIGANWRVNLGGGELSIRPTYTWQSRIFFDDNNDRPDLQQPPLALVADNIQDEVQDGFGLLNLRLGFRPANGNWMLEVYGENLTDETYLKDAGNTGDALGLPTFIAGAPRMLGAQITVRY